MNIIFDCIIIVLLVYFHVFKPTPTTIQKDTSPLSKQPPTKPSKKTSAKPPQEDKPGDTGVYAHDDEHDAIVEEEGMRSG